MARWPGNRWAALVGVALVGLAAGALLGGRTDLLDRAGVTSGDDRPALRVAAGAIDTFQDDTSDGADFVLPILNRTGSTTVDVAILGIPGLASGLTSVTVRDLRPGIWRGARFRAPANCDQPVPTSLDSVRLRITDDDRRTEVDVPLPDQARLLLEYQHAVCAPPSDDLTHHQLEGVWLVDQVFAGWPTPADAYLLRFDPDGTFVADPRGSLFSGRQGVWGRYRLDGELLTTDVTGGYGCDPGQRAVWRVGLQADGRLRMVWVRGSCPESTRGVWLSRRVLRDVGLPSRPPGRAPEGGLPLARASDTTVCLDRAASRPVLSLPAGFPADFYFSQATFLVRSDRVGGGAVRVSGITGSDLDAVRDLYLGAAQREGWSVTGSAVAEHHAEATWEGGGYEGRWALRDSVRCPGEVVVEVVARKQ